ncbi:hypothetical protein L9F63_019789 [Diploptera punctata]|uniref:Uncharacterized protein n=1 Tax=Diploptera punctata TaxID=6984 RepID=A0AAD7ZTL5_DIPPU|nr:hypothetical protein L9F63_019789 [Diploptera punctata]
MNHENEIDQKGQLQEIVKGWLSTTNIRYRPYKEELRGCSKLINDQMSDMLDCEEEMFLCSPRSSMLSLCSSDEGGALEHIFLGNVEDEKEEERREEQEEYYCYDDDEDDVEGYHNIKIKISRPRDLEKHIVKLNITRNPETEEWKVEISMSVGFDEEPKVTIWELN